jgi:transcriptional regulator with XRE-family HTH domain
MSLSKEEVTKKLGNSIRTIRQAKQLSIERLALDSGIEYTHLSRIELGKINTSIYHLYRISKSLNVSLNDLFYDITP